MGRRRPLMGRCSCPNFITLPNSCLLLLLLATFGTSRADDAEWQRMFPSSPYVGQQNNFARLQHPAVGAVAPSPSPASKSNRVSFADEDRAVPPPWLLPARQQHDQQQSMININGFPEAQLQVRSFFEDDSIEAQFNSQPWLNPQQMPSLAAAVLQPPQSVSKLATATATGNAPRHEQQVRPLTPSTTATATKEKNKKPTAVSGNPLPPVPLDVASADGHHLVASFTEVNAQFDPSRISRPFSSKLSTASAKIKSNNKPIAITRSSSFHDSTEYDYEDDSVVSKRTASTELPKFKNKKTLASSYETAADETVAADFYDDVPFNNNQRHSSETAEFVGAQSFDIDKPIAFRSPPLANARRQQPKQRDEFQKRDHNFGPQTDSFGWPQRGGVQQQRPSPLYSDASDASEFRPRDERPSSNRQSSTIHDNQQPLRKQQQQQSGRDRLHQTGEAPSFDDEFRPIFSPEHPPHRQQQQTTSSSSLASDEWPSRPVGNDRNTNRPRIQQPVRHQSSTEAQQRAPENQKRNKPKPSYPSYPEEVRERDLHLDSRPHHQHQQHSSSEFQQHDHHDEPQLNLRPPGGQQAGRRPQPQNNDDFRSPPPPNQQSQEEQQQPGSFVDNSSDQQQPELGSVEDHRPSSPPPGRRPANRQPPFNSGSDQFNAGGDQFNPGDPIFNGNNNNNPGNLAPFDEGEFNNFNNGPPPPRPFNGPRRPPPRPQQPNVISQAATAGLNSLRTLAGSIGLQSLAGNQQQRRPQRPNNGQFRPESRRPGPGNRRPPIELSIDIGRVDKTAEEEELALLSEADQQPGYDQEEDVTYSSSSESLVGRSSGGFIKQQEIEDPVEHRILPQEEEEVIDPQDYLSAYPHLLASSTAAPKFEPLAPVAKPTTAEAVTTTTSSTTSAPVEKATLFPPFSKRVRPQLPTPAETQKPNKESTAGQLRITSYKQRIEAMKERARLREQQLQQPNNKETEMELSNQPTGSIDSSKSDHKISSSSTTSTTTTTTTRKPSTTRAKVPPRMPVIRKPATSGFTTSTSTTEQAPTLDSSAEIPSKRRFKPKSSFSRSRPSLDEDDEESPIAAPLSDDKETLQEEETIAAINKNRNTFAKIPTSPFDLRRAQLQKEAAATGEEVGKQFASEVMVSNHSKKVGGKRRPHQSRTTAQPQPETAFSNDELASNLPAPTQPTVSPQQKASDDEQVGEEPRIELVEGGDVQAHDAEEQQPHHPAAAVPTYEDDYNYESESNHQLADEKKTEMPQEPSYLDTLLARNPHHLSSSLFSDDPILPIEELLNIRVRDNGKGM